MIKLLSFEEAIIESEAYSKRHLILGNGFSIGCFPKIFHYSSLLDQADFKSNFKLKKVFEKLKTQDFELVIKSLENCYRILPVYLDGKNIEDIKSDSEILKELLIETISKNHPHMPSEIDEKKYSFCKKFLSYFLGKNALGQVYTLNYDLLLYWVLMHLDPENDYQINSNDGFGNEEDEFESSYVVWPGYSTSNNQRVHFLHGALHLFDAGHQLKKHTWNRSGVPLLKQIGSAIENNEFPLFVAEGTAKQKMNKIKHSAYLYHSYKSLLSNFAVKKSCFFTYGHSLAENDSDILSKIGKGKFPHLYVGIYGDQFSYENKVIIKTAMNLASLRNEKTPLNISFYDSASANVWGNHQI